MNKFGIKKEIDLLLYRSFNIYSDILFHMDFKLKKVLRENKLYKNKHLGSRAFIIGTGPSLRNLKDEDIALLQGEILFAVNSYYKYEKFSKLKPDYYVLVDNNYWGLSNLAFDEINAIYGEDLTFITDYRAKALVGEKRDAIFLRSRNYPINFVNYDIEKNSSISLNVVGTSIMCAMYMGFNEIYILGCDFNSFCQKTNGHCYDDKEEKNLLKQYKLGFYLDEYARTAEIHYLIDKTARVNGITIKNATNNSLLDAYEFTCLASIFNKL